MRKKSQTAGESRTRLTRDTLIARERLHRETPESERGEAWLDAAWALADDLRASARDDLAERLEDACERVELSADGARIPRQRRSDAKGPPGTTALTVANGLRDGYDLDRACLYAGITVARHRSWMRHAGYASDFSSVG